MKNQQPKEKKLKPIVMRTSEYVSGAPETFKQMILLKSLQVTQDPRKLKELMMVRRVTDVYRTLDKLAMRREFHEALSRAGISFDYIVNGLRDLADNANDKVRLGAFQTLLKSVGMDVYGEIEGGTGGTWEEELLKSMEKKNQAKLPSGETPTGPEEYEVKVPEIPEEMRKLRQQEDELTRGLYE